MAKWVYMFTEGNATMRNLLGGKGANLAEMTSLGLPVPQGFTVTTEACTQYYEDGRKINDEIMSQIMDAIVKLEEITGKKFGDKENPLLVSVRSGARASMPGMMDTILNLGLNEEVVETLAEASGNARWAWDCYRRFIQMYSDVVMEVGKKYFEELIDKMKEEKGALMPILQKAQDIYGYLPKEVMKIISDETQIPMEKIYGVATFYSQFTLNPKGKYRISVCLGTACYVKGSGDIYNKLMEKLGIVGGECTPDGKFSLDACRCVGACGLAPVMMINDEVYGRLTVDDIDDILAKYE